MNKKLIFLLISIFLTFMQTNNQAQVNLIPKPQELKVLEGNFIVSKDVSFQASNVNDQLIKYLKDYLSELYSIKFTKASKEASSITLQVEKDFLNTRPEAYSLKIKPDKIIILASSEVGLFYGIQTLFQLLP